MSPRLRRQLTAFVSVFALLAGVLLVAFGAGYQVSRASMVDPSTWIAKVGHALRLNVDTRTPDAQVDDVPDGSRVVQGKNGDVYIVSADGQTRAVDTTTMRQGRPADGEVFVGGTRDKPAAFLVDRGKGTLAPLADPARAINVGRGVRGDPVVDDAGVAWLVSADGLRWSDGATAQLVGLPAGARPDFLTLVAGRPVVVSADGAVVRLGADRKPEKVIDAELAGRRVIGVNHPSSERPEVWMVVSAGGDAVSIVGVDLVSGKKSAAPLDGVSAGSVGQPLAVGERVYVGDHRRGRVLRVDAGSGRAGDPLPIRDHKRGQEFELFANAGYVLVNDPETRHVTIVDPKGQPETVEVAPSQEKTRREQDEAKEQETPQVETVHPPDPHPEPSSAPPASPLPTADPEPAPADVPVPELIGRSKDDACQTLTAVGLGCDYQSVGLRPGGQPDEVVGARPAAGSRVRPGTIVLIQHLGALTVPSVEGRGVAEACQLLTDARLRCDQQPLGPPPDADPAKVGRVESQDPAAGAPAGEGAQVTVRYHDKTVVPDVAGRQRADACAEIQRMLLTCAPQSLGPATAATPAPGVVVGQNPTGRVAADPGAQVVVSAYESPVVPAVQGKDKDQACAEVNAAGFACQPVVADAPSPPNVVHAQTPGAGTTAAPGTPVQVAYDDTPTAPLVRLKRKGTNVWVISSNPQHVQYLLGGGSGHEYINEAVLGQAYHPSTPASGFLVPFYSFFRSDGHVGTNRYYSTDPAPPAGWTRESGANNGIAGLVFNQPFPGTIPVYRLVKASGPDYTYATSQGDLAYYQSRGFSIEQVLGHVWP
jgi:beta-lactam-binding protein with PASTA domain